MATDYHVNIEVDNDVIVCTWKEGKVKGGNIKASAGDKVHFIGNGVQFTLAFENFPDGGTASPFNEANPTGAVSKFDGTLKAPPKLPSYYKFTVGVGSLRPLDPIIIVDN